jgi:hypothetical protein
MARPREFDDRTSTTLRVAPELLERLQDEADRREIGRNRLIVNLIEYGLPDYEGEAL